MEGRGGGGGALSSSVSPLLHPGADHKAAWNLGDAAGRLYSGYRGTFTMR